MSNLFTAIRIQLIYKKEKATFNSSWYCECSHIVLHEKQYPSSLTEMRTLQTVSDFVAITQLLNILLPQQHLFAH